MGLGGSNFYGFEVSIPAKKPRAKRTSSGCPDLIHCYLCPGCTSQLCDFYLFSDPFPPRNLSSKESGILFSMPKENGKTDLSFLRGKLRTNKIIKIRHSLKDSKSELLLLGTDIIEVKIIGLNEAGIAIVKIRNPRNIVNIVTCPAVVHKG